MKKTVFEKRLMPVDRYRLQ